LDDSVAVCTNEAEFRRLNCCIQVTPLFDLILLWQLLTDLGVLDRNAVVFLKGLNFQGIRTCLHVGLWHIAELFNFNIWKSIL